MVYYGYIPPSADDIYHHGVPGQKWGVKNGPPYPVVAGAKVTVNKRKMTKETRQRYDAGKSVRNRDDDSDGRTRLTRVRVSSLTDEQLQKRIARLKLENEYKALLRGDRAQQQKLNNGKSAAVSILTKTAETVLPEVGKTMLQVHIKNVEHRHRIDESRIDKNNNKNENKDKNKNKNNNNRDVGNEPPFTPSRFYAGREYANNLFG